MKLKGIALNGLELLRPRPCITALARLRTAAVACPSSTRGRGAEQHFLLTPNGFAVADYGRVKIGWQSADPEPQYQQAQLGLGAAPQIVGKLDRYKRNLTRRDGLSP